MVSKKSVAYISNLNLDCWILCYKKTSKTVEAALIMSDFFLKKILNSPRDEIDRPGCAICSQTGLPHCHCHAGNLTFSPPCCCFSLSSIISTLVIISVSLSLSLSLSVSSFSSQPPMVVCKMEAQSEHARVAYTFFARLEPTCMLGRCLLTKLSASELRRKFIKSALLVGSFFQSHPNPGWIPSWQKFLKASRQNRRKREECLLLLIPQSSNFKGAVEQKEIKTRKP